MICRGCKIAVDKQYTSDVEVILSHRHDHGADYWTTPDRHLLKGASFSALESALLLLESGMDPTEPILQEVAGLFFDAWQEDGRFKVYPKSGSFPARLPTPPICSARWGMLVIPGYS